MINVVIMLENCINSGNNRIAAENYFWTQYIFVVFRTCDAKPQRKKKEHSTILPDIYCPHTSSIKYKALI